MKQYNLQLNGTTLLLRVGHLSGRNVQSMLSRVLRIQWRLLALDELFCGGCSCQCNTICDPKMASGACNACSSQILSFRQFVMLKTKSLEQKDDSGWVVYNCQYVWMLPAMWGVWTNTFPCNLNTKLSKTRDKLTPYHRYVLSDYVIQTVSHSMTINKTLLYMRYLIAQDEA